MQLGNVSPIIIIIIITTQAFIDPKTKDKRAQKENSNKTFCEVQESTSFYSFIIKLHKQLELVQYLREWKLQKKCW